jgi:ribonuclease HI
MWGRCASKQKSYGRLSGNASFGFLNKEHARDTSRSLETRNFLTPQTVTALNKHQRLLNEDIRVLFESFDASNVQYEYDDDDDSDYSEYAQEKHWSRYAPTEGVKDRLLSIAALKKKLKIITLTDSEYNTLRSELCIHERTIRPEIVAETDLSYTYNNPEQFRQRCCYATAADNNESILEAWTDGSTNKDENYVAYAVHWGQHHPLNYVRRLDATRNTNNNAELAAIEHVLRVTPLSRHVVVFTDSQVAINIAEECRRCAETHGSVQALTRKDSIETARTKRTLVKQFHTRHLLGTQVRLEHVYSHLLDSGNSMSSEQRRSRLAEMKARFGNAYLHILHGNAAADRLAGSAKQAPLYSLPQIRANDPDFLALLTCPNVVADAEQHITSSVRIGEDLRKQVYEYERNENVAAHKQNQVKDRMENAHEIALDYACLDLSEHTDMKLSSLVMNAWRTKPKEAHTYNFLYRARRGALLEKSKAYHRIETEEQRASGKSLFARSYGSKYHWNKACPCCIDADEADGHVLWQCPHTNKSHRENLREEVMETLRGYMQDASHGALKRLPAWFACADDSVHMMMMNNNIPHYNGATAEESRLLKQIEQYDKHLGALGYIPLALIAWMNTQFWQDGKSGMTSAIRAVQKLLAERAHETWIHRCKRFEEQWRVETKKRKTEAEAEKKAAQERKAEEDRRKAEAHTHETTSRRTNSPSTSTCGAKTTSGASTRDRKKERESARACCLSLTYHWRVCTAV